MSYGIIIYNQDSYIQIDGENPNIGLAHKGIITLTGPSPYYLTFSGLTYPIIALAGGAYIESVTNVGNTYTWGVVSYTNTFEYYVFDTTVGIPAVPTTSYGMEIYNASGTRVYSSDVMPVRILANIESNPEELISYQDPSTNKRLAVLYKEVPPTYIYKYYTGSGSDPNFYDENSDLYRRYAYTPMSNQTATGQVYTLDGLQGTLYFPEAGINPPPPQSNTYYGSWSLYVIDVTGY